MPKDEFDFDDPMELSGVGFLTNEDTSEAMAECFTEEFLRMGYNPRQVLALFRTPAYVGPNMVLQNRGEAFVHEVIARVFAQWGKPFAWPDPPDKMCDKVSGKMTDEVPLPAVLELDTAATDPTGVAIPKL